MRSRQLRAPAVCCGKWAGRFRALGLGFLRFRVSGVLGLRVLGLRVGRRPAILAVRVVLSVQRLREM